MDDPVDAFPIHFCGGMIGLLSAPFLIPQGIFYKRDAQSAVVMEFVNIFAQLDAISEGPLQMFGCNMLGTVVIICWAILWCFPIFAILKRLGVLRVPLEMELAGMDGPKHNELAYPASAWNDDKTGLLDNKIVGNNWMPHHTKIGSSLSANLTLSNNIRRMKWPVDHHT